MDDGLQGSVQTGWESTGSGTAIDREELAGRGRRPEETEEGKVVSRL